VKVPSRPLLVAEGNAKVSEKFGQLKERSGKPVVSSGNFKGLAGKGRKELAGK